MNDFEEFINYDLDECLHEQNRQLTLIRNLKMNKKIMVKSYNDAQNVCEKKLNHLVARIEWLKASTDLPFEQFTIELNAKKESIARQRLMPDKKSYIQDHVQALRDAGMVSCEVVGSDEQSEEV